MGRSEPWGLVRGAPWPPPAVRCTLSLSSLICRRGAVRVSRLEVLRSGRAGLPPGMPPGSEGLGPRCWWRPLPSPAARPPLDLGRRQHLAAPPGDGGPTRGRGPCRHRRRPRDTPSSLALPRGRAGQASGEDWPRGGGGTTSPLSPQCPLLCSGGQPAPPSREALVASRCGCPTVTECWRPGPGRLPRRLQCGGARFSRRGRTGVRSPDMVALGPGGLQGRPRGPWLAHRQRSVTCPDQGCRGQVSWGRGTSKVLAAGQWASSPGPWALLSRPS